LIKPVPPRWNWAGFVPQKDIIHMELTIYQALDYAAQLRMPADMTSDERHKRVMEVLEDLDLTHRKDVQISGLSGGQQKRVSIGVELLTKPGLFFLDEPTSGLDPGTETALMQLMRRLADQGRTIVLITHATKNVMLGDKVIFLARGGYLAWFGPPEEALEYFDQYRSDRERRAGKIEFDEIYAILDNPDYGSAADWDKKYRESQAYQKYVAEPLKGKMAPDKAPTIKQPEKLARKTSGPGTKQVSALRQWCVPGRPGGASAASGRFPFRGRDRRLAHRGRKARAWSTVRRQWRRASVVRRSSR
jgi:ABC-type multidrug transport system ATPase subunit